MPERAVMINEGSVVFFLHSHTGLSSTTGPKEKQDYIRDGSEISQPAEVPSIANYRRSSFPWKNCMIES